MLPRITLEEHFLSNAFQKSSPSFVDNQLRLYPPSVTKKLVSLGEERIHDMDKGHVSLQVISHHGTGSPILCEKINDELFEAVLQNKNRFSGFAILPMNDPSIAADELSRCVKELRFVGARVPNHTNGRFYDDEFFWPIFERAQELDVPIYLHPAFATADMMSHYKGNYSGDIANVLSNFGWGWHSDTGLHILRLYASGVFDRYPRLKIILGHNGEMLPFMLDRFDSFTNKLIIRERNLRSVWDENIWITTSGMFSLAPFACLLRSTKIDRILYSVDYPYSSNEDGNQFINEISKSGLVTEDELVMITYRNAQTLLKLHV